MNKLNVLGYGYLPFRLRNIPHNIKQFFRNIKYAWQRVTKGYCDQDLWNMDYFYSQLFVGSMRDFVKDLHGAPSKFYDEETDSIQLWIEYVNTMAQHFYNSIDENEVMKNEYDLPKLWEVDKLTGDLVKHHRTSEEEELVEKWAKREREIDNWREAEKDKGFDMMKEVFFSLWD